MMKTMASGVIAGFAAVRRDRCPSRLRRVGGKKKKEAKARDAFAEFPPARRAPEFAAGPQDPASVERAALIFARAPVFRGVPGNIHFTSRGSAPARRAGARDGGGDGAGLRAARLRSRSGSTAPPTVTGGGPTLRPEESSPLSLPLFFSSPIRVWGHVNYLFLSWSHQIFMINGRTIRPKFRHTPAKN